VSRQAFAPLCDELARWLVEPPASPPEWQAARWEDCRLTIQVHGVAPLLWLAIRRLPAWVESPTGHWLADQYVWNARRVGRLHSDLSEVLHLFAAEGVPILPLKGVLLGLLFYEDPAARPMADLDVLLREEHWPAGEALLGRLGYDKIFSGWKHARFVRPDGRTIADPSCEHPDNPRQLEVHPRCRERIRDEEVDLTDRMWESARHGELLGAGAWLPDADVLWLYLLLHATHHVLLNNFRLVQLADLQRLAPFVREPGKLLDTVDARGTYPALALWNRTFPDSGRTELLARLHGRLSPDFAAWADSLDLYEVCHLNPAPWRAA
jgi:hypothetical protein